MLARLRHPRRVSLAGVRGLATFHHVATPRTSINTSSDGPRTMYDKIWDDHIVEGSSDGSALLYIDRHLVHEVTSPQAFEGLEQAGRPVRRPDCTLVTVDHNVPTSSRDKFADIKSFIKNDQSREQVLAVERNVQKFDLCYFCLLYTSPSPRDGLLSRMPSSA